MLQTNSGDGQVEGWGIPEQMLSPRLQVRTIERTAVVRFSDAQVLFAERDVDAVREQLYRLAEEGGHTCLVLNLSDVKYVSTVFIGVLLGLHLKMRSAGRCLHLCAPNDLLQETMKVTRLNREFEIFANEAEALGLLTR